jgi:tetratricopeptide (TPR) repeat protein
LERHQEAYDWEKKLAKIDPSANPDPTLFWLGRIDEAIQIINERRNFTSNPSTYSTLGFIYLNSGSYQEAIDALLKALDLTGRRLPRMLAWLAAAYVKNGQEDKANDLLEELKGIREQSLAGSPSFYIAVMYSALDEKELAFQWLEQAYEDHDMEMVWLKAEPQLYPLHDDPRFLDLAKRVGFDVSG